MRLHLPSLLLVAVVGGCAKDITLADRDGATSRDVSSSPDSGADVDATAMDGSLADATNTPDAGLIADGSTPLDGGDGPCPGRALCVAYRSITATVGEVVTLVPEVYPPGAAVTFSGILGTSAARAAGRPALIESEVTSVAAVDPSGVLTFRLLEVPPWFWTTTFTFTISVEGEGEMFDVAPSVRVLGNTLIATGSGGDGILAVQSDGAPARGVRSAFPLGTIADGNTIQTPRAMLLSGDGSILVMNDRTGGARIVRFDASSQNNVLDQFDAVFRSGGTMSYSIAELSDGRVAATDFAFSGTPKSQLVLFDADGNHTMTFDAPTRDAQWRGIAAAPNDMLWVADRESNQVVIVSPVTGAVQGTLVDNLPGQPNALLALDDGTLYISGSTFVVRRSPNGDVIAVSGRPGSSSTHWRPLALDGEGRLLVGRDRRDSSTNIAVFEDLQWQGWLRPDGVGGRSLQPWGLVVLE